MHWSTNSSSCSLIASPFAASLADPWYINKYAFVAARCLTADVTLAVSALHWPLWRMRIAPPPPFQTSTGPWFPSLQGSLCIISVVTGGFAHARRSLLVKPDIANNASVQQVDRAPVQTAGAALCRNAQQTACTSARSLQLSFPPRRTVKFYRCRRLEARQSAHAKHAESAASTFLLFTNELSKRERSTAPHMKDASMVWTESSLPATGGKAASTGSSGLPLLSMQPFPQAGACW